MYLALHSYHSVDYAFFFGGGGGGGEEEGWLNLSIWYLTAFSEGLFSFTGIGYSSQVIETYLNIYYIIILSWALFYLFSSFTTVLPWAIFANVCEKGFLRGWKEGCSYCFPRSSSPSGQHIAREICPWEEPIPFPFVSCVAAPFTITTL